MPPPNPYRQTVIESEAGWQLIDWKEIWAYKDLLYFLVWRNVKVLYKQTVLGFAWAVINPLFTMVVFSVIFGHLAKLPSDGVPYPIFAFAALVPWTYFSGAMSSSALSLIANANLVTKVYCPRLILPITPVLAKLVDFTLAFIVLVLMMAWYGIVPTWDAVFLPFLVLLMILTAYGMGTWLSAMAIQYRDVAQGMPFLSQILMYTAPVVWPVSLIPDQYRLIYGLYPMAGVIEGFRSSLIGTNPMPWDLIFMGTLSSLLIAFSGAVYFRRMERIFADVI